MGKIKCMRAIRRVKNIANALNQIRNTKVVLKLTKRNFKGVIKTGINAIDKDMLQLLKMEGKSNSKAKRIIKATKYAYYKAEIA